jgi:hypothetical protein
MTFHKHQRDKLSLLGRLRSALHLSQAPARSRVAQPGARLRPAEGHALSRRDADFGKRPRPNR